VKAGASILVVIAVGALAGAIAASRGSASDVASPGAVLDIVEPRLEWRAPDSPAPRLLPRTPLIDVPKLHLKARIGRDVDAGPAWWPVTGRPGGGDTVAIAGHRTTHTRPFYWLDRLELGDAIYVRWAGRMHAYEVTGRRILSARDLHIADARGHEVLLLSACTPRGSSRQRIVVYARPRLHA
jgi:LPXTG-site transpeptidase (sortase) family protein